RRVDLRVVGGEGGGYGPCEHCHDKEPCESLHGCPPSVRESVRVTSLGHDRRHCPRAPGLGPACSASRRAGSSSRRARGPPRRGPPWRRDRAGRRPCGWPPSSPSRRTTGGGGG